jgi:hypothetical protein
MDTSPKSLSGAENSAMFFEDSRRSIEPGTLVYRALRLHDKNTFIFLFILVFLSIPAIMSRTDMTFGPKCRA